MGNKVPQSAYLLATDAGVAEFAIDLAKGIRSVMPSEHNNRQLKWADH